MISEGRNPDWIPGEAASSARARAGLSPPRAYAELERRFLRLSHLEGAASVLHWDWAAMMPPGGARARAEQLATLEGLSHELLTEPRLAELLAEAESGADALGDWQRANLREMTRRVRRANAVPRDLLEAFAMARAASEMRWRAARAEDDFEGFAESFRGLLGLLQELARVKAEALGLAPYDALLDDYEPCVRSAEIDLLFDDLAAFLPGFLSDVLAHQAQGPKPLPLEGPFPPAAQRDLALRLMTVLGFDFACGRLDVSEHPFCGGVPEDVRITTRYRVDDFASALMAVLHETGHALYERGLPQAWRGQPVGTAPSMGLHESQSLLIEMQACRGREFLGFAAPLIREAFAPYVDTSGSAWEPENLARHYLWVEPGLIRVDADEVTYPLHVLLRYRLEKAMIAGDLAVEDLPGAWNEGMREALGLVPETDREGCLQDVHWAEGVFGYFPSYTLGAMMAAQLFDAARRAGASIPAALAEGDFRPLTGWLRENVHGYGSFYPAFDLVERASGRRLDPEVYKRHLKARYLS